MIELIKKEFTHLHPILFNTKKRKAFVQKLIIWRNYPLFNTIKTNKKLRLTESSLTRITLSKYKNC